MKKISCIALSVIFLSLISTTSFAQGIVDTATLKLTAKEITSGNTTSLSLKFDVTLNRKPQTECKVNLYAIFSDIGVEDSESRRFKITTKTIKKGSPKKVSFSYLGAALDGNIGDQQQGTFQVSVKCGLEDVVFSSLAAANLTCQGGLTLPRFRQALRSRIR